MEIAPPSHLASAPVDDAAADTAAQEAETEAQERLTSKRDRKHDKKSGRRDRRRDQRGQCAFKAEWIATVAEALAELEPRAVEVSLGATGASQEARGESLAVVLNVTRDCLDAATRYLDESFAAWLAEDPEHWGIFRLMLLDAWQPKPGQWYEGAPQWVYILATEAAVLQGRSDLILPPRDT